MVSVTKTIKITPETAVKLWKHTTEAKISPIGQITIDTKTDICIQDVPGKGLCILIKGTFQNAIQAIDKIINLKNEIDNKNTKIKKVSLDIDFRDIGFVVGCGGKTIKMIAERTGCEISTTRGNERTPAQVHIKADSVAKIESAKELVWGAANEALRRRKEVENFNIHISPPHCFVEIDNRDIGYVIGKRGATIQMIAEKTNCFIKPMNTDYTKPEKIYIEGPNLMCVENAKQFIFKVAQESYIRRMSIKPVVIPPEKFHPMDAILPAGAITDGIECQDIENNCSKIVKFDTSKNKYIEKTTLNKIIEEKPSEFVIVNETTNKDDIDSEEDEDDDEDDEEEDVNVIINVNTNSDNTTEELCWGDI